MTKPNRAPKLPKFLLAGALVVAASLLAGCAGGTGSNAVSGDHLTIYSSLPLTGPNRQVSDQILAGEKLALKQNGGKAGKLDVGFISLNDADPKTGEWTPTAISENARKVAGDQSAIAYIGDSIPGSSVISVPIMNEAGVLTVSPLDNYAGLTVSAGVEKGEPDKYYPSGDRTFGRVVPPSNIEAEAVVAAMKKNNVKTALLISDTGLYGRSIVQTVDHKAGSIKATVAKSQIDWNKDTAAGFKAIADEASAAKVDAIFVGATSNGPDESSVDLWQALSDANSKATLYAPSALLQPDFYGKLKPALAAKTQAVSYLTLPKSYDTAGKTFVSDYKAEYGSEPGPYAVYGYTAMGAVLESLKAAKDKANDRTTVIDEFYKIKNQPSPLGEYTIDANGDTSIESFYGYSIKGGTLVSEGKLK